MVYQYKNTERRPHTQIEVPSNEHADLAQALTELPAFRDIIATMTDRLQQVVREQVVNHRAFSLIFQYPSALGDQLTIDVLERGLDGAFELAVLDPALQDCFGRTIEVTRVQRRADQDNKVLFEHDTASDPTILQCRVWYMLLPVTGELIR